LLPVRGAGGWGTPLNLSRPTEEKNGGKMKVFLEARSFPELMATLVWLSRDPTFSWGNREGFFISYKGEPVTLVDRTEEADVVIPVPDQSAVQLYESWEERCGVCGYVATPRELAGDYHCPICGWDSFWGAFNCPGGAAMVYDTVLPYHKRSRWGREFSDKLREPVSKAVEWLLRRWHAWCFCLPFEGREEYRQRLKVVDPAEELRKIPEEEFEKIRRALPPKERRALEKLRRG
jgi:predicted RNA-binding Zn-ribbon protein involved in translation (DUF1610 family)